jgi:hypothetical protein
MKNPILLLRSSCAPLQRMFHIGLGLLFSSTGLSAGELGKLTREVWQNFSVNNLCASDLSPVFVTPPTSREWITGAESPIHIGDQYVQRLRGWVIPEATGEHTFWISGDDRCHLWLSTDASQFNRQKIAWLVNHTGVREWTKFPSQQSVAIYLEAGQKYFIEATHQEYGGGDHISIGWQAPGGVREVLPSRVIESFDFDPNDVDGDDLPDDWEVSYGLSTTATSGAEGTDGKEGDPDLDGLSNYAEWLAGSNPVEYGRIAGGLTREVWTDISGATVSTLTSDPKFIEKPAVRDFLAGADAVRNLADSYGQRLRGYVIIPATGNYRFHISGDDRAELWLAENGSHFSRRKVAMLTIFSAYQQWGNHAAQTSEELQLLEGQRIYIEALHKEGPLDDHLSIGWSRDGAPAELIPAACLESFASPEDDVDEDLLPDSWELTHGFTVGDNGRFNPDEHPDADPDGDGISNINEYLSQGDPNRSGGNVGYFHREYWTGIEGNSVASLTSNPRFVQPPDISHAVAGDLESRNPLDLYGQRIRGLIVPPRTGQWRFWLSSDDASQLLLSNSPSAFGKKKIAEVNRPTILRDFDAYASQKSEWISLIAGESYYYEILHKEGVALDHVSVAWEYQPAGINYAAASQGATATQSTNFSADYSAARAIDGNTDGSPASGMAHTEDQPSSWWQVDLGQNREINQVVLFNRTDGDNQQRLSNFRVSALDANGNELAGQDYFTSSGYVQGTLAWNLPTAVNARKIKVQILGQNLKGNGYLCLSEVQVYETVSESNRQVIGANHLLSLFHDPLDEDGDSLPDAWEVQMGLDPTDNGAVNPANAEYADSDRDLLTNFEEFTLGTHPLVADPAPGRWTFDRWIGVPHYTIDELKVADQFYSQPTERSLLANSSYKTETTYEGIRLRGYLEAPESGYYHFWVSGRNSVELWLSTDSTKYRKQRIARLCPSIGTGHGIPSTSTNYWDVYVSQMSEPIYLEQGQRYFIEGLNQNGHNYSNHFSVAWARPGKDRESLPVEYLSSYTGSSEDLDDDYLPDAWESQYGLDAGNNGLTDRARQGERGDFDEDGLTNLEEYLLGTHPTQADSDGDGVSDFDEVHSYGTSPLESNSLDSSEIPAPELTDYNAAHTTGTWQIFDGGLLGSSFRGKIEWSFSVPTDGWWHIDLGARLRGNLRSTEDLDLGVKIDGRALGPKVMRFLNGKSANLKILTPYLSAGIHTFELDIRNEIGRRTLQIQSLKISGAGGFDADENGRPDWLDSVLLQANTLVPVLAESYVSPLFIEGSTRHLGGVAVSAASQPVDVKRGLGDLHWFANVPLQSSGTTSLFVNFENGTQTPLVEWVRWNAMSGLDLRVRAGDSLKIGGWVSDDDAGNVQITVDGQTSNLSASGFVLKTFGQAGSYPVTVTHSNGSQTTATVNVYSADFGNPLSFYSDTLTWRSFPQIPAVLKIAGEPSLGVDVTQPEGSGQKALLRPFRSGTHVLAARLPDGGPILALGEISTIGVADALRGDAATYVGSTSDGYRILRTPIVITDFPPGGTVVITIFRAGVTFLDGTIVMTLTESDFENGVAYIDFRYPPEMSGGYCHYTDLYDAQGRNLGRR